MLWFLALHISAMLFWCAALLYLPALIASAAAGRTDMIESPRQHKSIARFVFTHIATPAAVVAIIAGTLVFIVGNIVTVWLIAKLTLVAALVVFHALTGLLILRLENDLEKPVRLWCWVLAAIFCVLMTAIVWLVLAKPDLEAFL